MVFRSFSIFWLTHVLIDSSREPLVISLPCCQMLCNKINAVYYESGFFQLVWALWSVKRHLFNFTDGKSRRLMAIAVDYISWGFQRREGRSVKATFFDIDDFRQIWQSCNWTSSGSPSSWFSCNRQRSWQLVWIARAPSPRVSSKFYLRLKARYRC